MIRTLYEDEHFVAYDKPAGLLVHRGIGEAEVTLAELVREQSGETPRPVHRLDRGTSGVIVFARTAAACAALQSRFEAHLVTKTYLALVRGVPAEHGEIDHPVPRTEGGPRVPAQTAFWRLEVFDAAPRALSLVVAQPRTGRFHQIRRHLKHIDHPIIGDANYGKGPLNRAIRDAYGLSRLALHALQIDFAHPVTGELVSVHAPVPDDLITPLGRMRPFT